MEITERATGRKRSKSTVFISTIIAFPNERFNFQKIVAQFLSESASNATGSKLKPNFAPFTLLCPVKVRGG